MNHTSKLHLGLLGRRLLIALAAITALASGTQAAVLIDGNQTTLATFSTGNYSRGNEFTLTSPLTIYGLAYVDAEGDGLSTTHTVTLWETAGQSLLASATVTPSDAFSPSANGISRWYETPTAPLVLNPGTYRVVGLYNSADAGVDTPVFTNFVGASAASGYVRNGFPGGGISYPGESYGTQQLTANVVTSLVPEPSTYALLAGALATVSLLLRRRRA